MKRWICVFVINLCFVAVDCRAEFTYKEMQHVYETTENGAGQVMDNYLLGLHEGINASNLAYYMQTRTFLYCQPNNFDLNVTNIKSIIKDAHEAYDTEGTIPVSYLLFVGLKKTFPCL